MSAENIAVAALTCLHSPTSNMQVATTKDDGNEAVKERTGAVKSATVTVSGQPASSSKRRHKKHGKRGEKRKDWMVFPVEPTVIQVVKKPRTFTNHSYRDFSLVPPEVNEVTPTEISKMTFPQKVHHILSQPQYSQFIRWQPHGRAFCIVFPKMFESKVCPQYLGHARYSSFLRQLSNHSFKHITQGKDRNCHYHEVC